uniref:Uncharacterized protein n=1 Tax=Oryza brachyantha TaxID=4533 RepID=J3NF95_ORYBR
MAPNAVDDEKPVVLVTGCAKGGIGYEYCQAFSSLGCRVVATDAGSATDAGVFARHVARRVMSPRPPREIVYGSMTALFAALAAAPLWARDAFFANRFGLAKMMR